jgi:hypothetical protein
MRTLAAALLLATPAFGGYQYYLTDNFTTIDASRWSSTGALSPTGSGLAAPDANGGSVISRVPIPDGTNEAEVSITLNLAASGGVYTLFVQATADARTSRAATRTYLAFEMQNPQIDRSGACTANSSCSRALAV